jgi:hypothetical protein
LRKAIIYIILVFLFLPVFSGDIVFNSSMTNEDFKSFTKEFGTVIAFNPISPAEKLGILGFDIGAEFIVSDISSNASYFENAGSFDNQLYTTRIHFQKGLPGGFDVGAMFFNVRDTNGKGWGISLKYTLVDENLVLPSLSFRTTYTKLTGVDDLSMDTVSLGAMLSKDFLILTPYLSIEAIKISASEHSDLVELNSADETVIRKALGLKFTFFPFLSLNGEYAFGEIDQYSLKLAFRF